MGITRLVKLNVLKSYVKVTYDEIDPEKTARSSVISAGLSAVITVQNSAADCLKEPTNSSTCGLNK